MNAKNIAEFIEQFDLITLKREIDQYTDRGDRLAHYEDWLAMLDSAGHRELLEDVYYIIEKLGSNDLCQRWQNLHRDARKQVLSFGLNPSSKLLQRIMTGYIKQATPEEINDLPSPAYISAFCMFVVGQ